MKLKLLVALAVIAAAVVSASAQTNNVSLPFYDQALAWGTSFNTDPAVAWTNQVNANIEFSTGDRQVSGIGAKNYVIGQDDLGAWNVGGEVDFAGVGSVISGGEVRGGYAFVQIADFKVEANLGAGYGQNSTAVYSPVIEPEIALKKKLTHNTFAEFRLSEPVYFRGKFDSVPTIKAGVGFTF